MLERWKNLPGALFSKPYLYRAFIAPSKSYSPLFRVFLVLEIIRIRLPSARAIIRRRRSSLCTRRLARRSKNYLTAYMIADCKYAYRSS